MGGVKTGWDCPYCGCRYGHHDDCQKIKNQRDRDESDAYSAEYRRKSSRTPIEEFDDED